MDREKGRNVRGHGTRNGQVKEVDRLLFFDGQNLSPSLFLILNLCRVLYAGKCSK